MLALIHSGSLILVLLVWSPGLQLEEKLEILIQLRRRLSRCLVGTRLCTCFSPGSNVRSSWKSLLDSGRLSRCVVGTQYAIRFPIKCEILLRFD
jgi:hypothetical protein